MCAGGQVDGGNSSTVAWYQGESEVDTVYSSVITSYDYDAPIGESGAYGQPGIGGPNKFEVRAFSAWREPRTSNHYQTRRLGPVGQWRPGRSPQHTPKTLKPIGESGA